MQHLIKIAKSIFVGMGSILPGISGSMVAAILKIYQDLIEALNNITKHPIESIKSIWQYIVGIMLGLGFGFLFIRLFYEQFPIPLTLLFIGFILGAIPSLLKEIQGVHLNYKHFIVMGMAILLMIGFLFITENESSTGSWTYYIIVFMVGAITAIALITPGLSGATLLMALGYFRLLIQIGSDVIEAIVTFNFSEVLPMLPTLLVLMLGVLVGLIVIGKLMYFILKSYKAYFYIAILGIVFVSPFNVLFTLQENTSDNVFQAAWYVWVIGSLLFVLGIYITYMISIKGQKEEMKS
jgi:putative membrane protein